MSGNQLPPAQPVKKRIAIILGNDIEKKAVTPLKYLILHLNSLQSYFEYEFLPQPQDEFLSMTAGEEVQNRHAFIEMIPGFLERYTAFLEEQRIVYKLRSTEALPDYYILVSLRKFDDNYYLTGKGRMGVIALGNWKRLMSPPSFLEFVFTLVLVESVYLLEKGEGLSHLGTKGCLFDFNVELNNARYSALQPFICSSCKTVMHSDYPGLYEELSRILDKSWLGTSADPSSPAGLISALGYDLFYTKGMKQTLGERLKIALRDEGVKEIIKIISGILLAAAIVLLGIKK